MTDLSALTVPGSMPDPMTAKYAPSHRTLIRPPSAWPELGLGELWRYRDLLLVLVWRDISANYRQSIIGYGWAVFKPLLTMIVFSVIFGMFARFPSDGLPYPLFVFAGLLPWLYFSSCLTGTSNSVVGNAHLLTKVYFPRLILPLTSLVSGLADFTIQFILLGGMMLWFGVAPSWTILLVPGLVVLAMLAALSVGLWLTAINVKFRDVGVMVPFLLQMWIWITPIAYPSSLVPERWRLLYALNPMTGVVDTFRWALFGTAPPNGPMMGISFSVVAILLISGLYYFRKVERTFADVI
jgi:lipopolysaccharide transport system permease protein